MKVFFDSNVLIKYLYGSDDARGLVERALDGDWTGYINDVVISEVFYGYLRLATGLPKHELRRYISREGPALGSLLERDVVPLLEGFEVLPTDADAHEVADIMGRFGLLPNDALIAATCRHYGIDMIATFDEDFKKIGWLKTVP
ncbi:MAG: type II toxin-antitoxin system VapC family toxin [Thermoproteus sp.]